MADSGPRYSVGSIGGRHGPGNNLGNLQAEITSLARELLHRELKVSGERLAKQLGHKIQELLSDDKPVRKRRVSRQLSLDSKSALGRSNSVDSLKNSSSVAVNDAVRAIPTDKTAATMGHRVSLRSVTEEPEFFNGFSFPEYDYGTYSASSDDFTMKESIKTVDRGSRSTSVSSRFGFPMVGLKTKRRSYLVNTTTHDAAVPLSSRTPRDAKTESSRSAPSNYRRINDLTGAASPMYSPVGSPKSSPVISPRVGATSVRDLTLAPAEPKADRRSWLQTGKVATQRLSQAQMSLLHDDDDVPEMDTLPEMAPQSSMATPISRRNSMLDGFHMFHTTSMVDEEDEMEDVSNRVNRSHRHLFSSTNRSKSTVCAEEQLDNIRRTDTDQNAGPRLMRGYTRQTSVVLPGGTTLPKADAAQVSAARMAADNSSPLDSCEINHFARKTATAVEGKRPAPSFSMDPAIIEDSEPDSSTGDPRNSSYRVDTPRGRRGLQSAGMAPRLSERNRFGGDGSDDEEEEEEERLSYSQEFALVLVHHPGFVYLTTAIILANTLLVGLETDHMARNWITTPPLVFKNCERVFISLFSIELLIRICAYRCGLLTARDWRWNMFDVVLLSTQILYEVVNDTIYFLKASDEGKYVQGISMSEWHWPSLLPALRVLRLIRILRTAHLVHLAGELRMLLVSIGDSLHFMLWAFVLLISMMYCISVYLTYTVTIHKVANQHNAGVDQQLLEAFYGSLDKSMLSLFFSISSGISWHEAMDPLTVHCSPWLTFVFLFYIAFTVFVILNVITGVFVESATEKANEDKKKVLMYHLRKLFQSADTDGAGVLDWTKFQSQLDNPNMHRYLRAIDLDGEEAWDLFQLLDLDGSNEVDIDEFVHGCLRLHGFAKAIDLQTFMYNYTEWTHVWQVHADKIEDMMDRFFLMLTPQVDGLGTGSRVIGRESLNPQLS